MARICGAPRNQRGLFGRLFVGIVYSLTKRRLGRVIMPIQVTSHHTRILWGYTQMEQSQMSAKIVDPKLKGLAELRVATRVGCPFLNRHWLCVRQRTWNHGGADRESWQLSRQSQFL